ncbi:hypothetical protein SFRURICE_008421 [Spodoptera frugiperda]|nr:hypothetical protein SFRURICE_008421 [Spodoptera frugiperda]
MEDKDVNCEVGDSKVRSDLDSSVLCKPLQVSASHHSLTPSYDYYRRWETVGLTSNGLFGNSIEFKIMSYNVRSQSLLEKYPWFYKKCPSQSLLWENRVRLLFNDIINQLPDILCLQEIEEKQVGMFNLKLNELGYQGVYKKKSSDAMSDGCATYIKQSTFKFGDVTFVEFSQPKVTILDRHNIGIITKLIPKRMPAKTLVVANTHLLYNESKGIIRLAQMKVFLAEIDRVSYVFNGRDSGYLPIILTGDFNSKPDSPVVELLQVGQVSSVEEKQWNNEEWQKIGITDNCQHLSVFVNRSYGLSTDFRELCIYNSEYSSSCEQGSKSFTSEMLHEAVYYDLFHSNIVSNTLHFRTIYETNRGKQNRFFEASVYHDTWYLIDYIFYTACSGLRPIERFSLLDSCDRKNVGTLPSDYYGSDHISLVVVFELTSKRPF